MKIDYFIPDEVLYVKAAEPYSSATQYIPLVKHNVAHKLFCQNNESQTVDREGHNI